MFTYRIAGSGIEPVLRDAASLTAASLALPPGVYTTLRTYGGRCALRLEEHLARLESSAALLGCALVLDRSQVRLALRAALAAAGYAESRVRVTATFASGRAPAAVYLSVERLEPPDPACYASGVRVACVPLARELPRAKSTAFIAVAAALYAHKPPVVYEYVMVGPDGALLEGLTSNFFAVRGAALYTAGEGVLAGVTRAVVLEEALRQGLQVNYQAARHGDLATLGEAFITSSSRDVVPVVAIDGQVLGDGRPGRVTASLLAGYRARVAAEVAEI